MDGTHLSGMSGIAGTSMQPLQRQLSDTVPESADRVCIQEHTPTPGEGEDFLELPGRFNYDGYQVVRREFFAHINEPSVTFNNYKFYVNAACLNRFPDVDFVQVLVNQERKILAIRPCRADERDACAWHTAGSGRRKPKQITCKLFFAKVFSLMDWNLDYRYKLLGRIIHAKDEWLIAFDLTATEIYQRARKSGEKPHASRLPVFPEEWQTQFGLPFKEHQKSMQIDIFDGYAIYGLRDNLDGGTSTEAAVLKPNCTPAPHIAAQEVFAHEP